MRARQRLSSTHLYLEILDTHTQQPLEDVWTKTVVSPLVSIDPALPSLLKFTDLLADTTRKTNAIGQGSEGQGSEGLVSEGRTTKGRAAKGRPALMSGKVRGGKAEQAPQTVRNLETLQHWRSVKRRRLRSCRTRALKSRICRRSSLIVSCASGRSTGA